MTGLIPQICIEELRDFDPIIISLSGGTQSTAIAIDLYNQNIEARMVFFDTGIESKETYSTIKKVVEKTGFSLDTIKPKVPTKQAIMEGFEAIDKAYKQNEKGKPFEHKLFVCCDYLKKEPAKLYYRDLPDKTIILLGFTRYDSHYRTLFLYELENKINRCNNNRYNYIHFVKKKKIHCGYPLRDIRSHKIIRDFLDNNGFQDTISSGCQLCPIVLFKKMIKKDPKAYVRSKKFYLKHFKGQSFCGELNHSIEDFIS